MGLCLVIACVAIWAWSTAAPGGETSPVTSRRDLTNLPANTWVPLGTYTCEQLPGAGPDERGRWMGQGWNKLVYDPVGKRVLFYDRWADRKHGGWTIYGNCLFGLDPATMKITPLRVANWTKKDVGGGYRTLERPENAKEPTPCPRHVYHGFEFVPDLNALFICSGANGTAMRDGRLQAHLLCANLWRLDLDKKTWTQVAPGQHPTKESLDDGMAYSPETTSLILTMKGRVWIHDIPSGRWRKAKQQPPTGGSGQTIFYDPPRKRMLLAGGGPLDRWKNPSYNRLYAFDPKTETVTRLADCPTAQYSAHLAYDSKRDIFVTANVMQKGEQPSGTFVYDPKKDVWKEVKTTNPIPVSPTGPWFGWVRMCYDAEHDCFVAMIHPDLFYAFRCVPPKAPGGGQPSLPGQP